MRYRTTAEIEKYGHLSEELAAAMVQMQALVQMAETLTLQARALGFILEIVQEPEFPLAMGNHRDTINVRYARPRYQHLMAQES